MTPGTRARRLIVFTDLDGTLLDSRTYSAAPARGAMARLAALGVPVVFCSSKTAAEQRPLRQELGVAAAPFIVENGSAVLVPADAGLVVGDWPRANESSSERVRVLGRPAADVRAALTRVSTVTGLPLRGYRDLTAQQIAALTGLDVPAAERASRRDYSETLTGELSSGQWQHVQHALSAEGFRCVHGGRFRTVTGAAADKGQAARLVLDLYRTTDQSEWVTAGLGDSENDAELLAVVDHPYLLGRANGGWSRVDLPKVRKIGTAGPAGWSEAIGQLLSESRM